jgi:hypothetical protein
VVCHCRVPNQRRDILVRCVAAKRLTAAGFEAPAAEPATIIIAVIAKAAKAWITSSKIIASISFCELSGTLSSRRIFRKQLWVASRTA